MADEVHRLVEEVVSEELGSLQKRLEELELYRADTESSLSEIEAVVAEIKDSFISLHEDTAKRLTEYNSKLDGLAGQISGLKSAVEKLLSKMK